MTGDYLPKKATVSIQYLFKPHPHSGDGFLVPVVVELLPHHLANDWHQPSPGAYNHMELVLAVCHLRAADKGTSETQILNFPLDKTVSSQLHNRQFDLDPRVTPSLAVIDHILILVSVNKGPAGGVSKGYARTLDI
jgi:hypothetical protein